MATIPQTKVSALRIDVLQREHKRQSEQREPDRDAGEKQRKGQWLPADQLRDGKELYYVAPDGSMLAASIARNGTTPVPGTLVRLFQTRNAGGGTEADTRQQYDVDADGRFLVNVTTDQASASPITVVLNWAGALKK